MTLILADETSFNRLALKARTPAVAFFRAASCEVCQAAGPELERAAADFAGRVRCVAVDADESRLLAEQFSVWALPTYLALRGGDEIARACGFLPAGLLRLFFERVLEGGGPSSAVWQPSEQQLEDAVLVPMLSSWGWACQRQERCSVSGSGRATRGFIDLLVFAPGCERPLTLFENKRRIAGDEELRRAAGQAERYARAIGLRSFVVAEPAALWVYTLSARGAALVQRFDAFRLAGSDAALRELLVALA